VSTLSSLTLPRPEGPPVSPDSGQPRRPHVQGLDCKGPSLPRVFSINQGCSCEVSVLVGSSVQIGNFNSKRDIVVTCKIPRKSQEDQKIANSILLGSWWGELQLLSDSPSMFRDIFSMKNRNVKNLDLQYDKIHRSSVSNVSICCV
jgi:hypothetical protein